MSRQTCKKVADLSGGANLTLFPVDSKALQRLAQIATSDQLQQNRLTTVVIIMALLEPLLKDIDRLEGLAKGIHPTPSDLIKAITETRRTIEQLYGLLDDCYRLV